MRYRNRAKPACLKRDRRVTFLLMDTLAEIEAAAETLPPEQKEELFLFLAARLNARKMAESKPPRLARSNRGFPISRGRAPITVEDVTLIETEMELGDLVVGR